MVGDGFRWLLERTHFPFGFWVTFGRDLSSEELLVRLGCVPEYTAVMDVMEAEELRDDLDGSSDEDVIIAAVRSGYRNGWAFGLEHATLYAADHEVLSRVSLGTEAASLRRDAAHLETWFGLWRDGRLVEDHTAWGPDDLADLEAALGIDAPLLELLSPASALLTRFARWDA